jgi:hypothetical protein
VTTLPATCNGGTIGVATDKVVVVSAGVGTEYTCTAPNTWTASGNVNTGANNTFTGTNVFSGASSSSFGYDITVDGVPVTHGTTVPTVSATTALNAMIANRCPVLGTGAGCQINFPPNTNILLTAAAGAQSAIPILRDGVRFNCAGGHAPQYTSTFGTASCNIVIGTAGIYAFSVGQLGLVPLETTPSAGPLFEGFEFYDNTTLHNAGGGITVADTNKVRGSGMALVNGFRQPAVNAPSAPTCSIVAGGSLASGDQVNVELEAVTTSGSSLPSAPTNCGTTSGGNQSVSITIPAPSGVIIGYEALCQVVGVNAQVFTCSPNPTYTINGDGSQTINWQTTSPLVVSAPAQIGTRVAMNIDDSKTGGFHFAGSIGFPGTPVKAGFSNGIYFEEISCQLVQGCVVAGIGSATVTFDNLEVDACDVVLATGLCGGSTSPANGTTIFATPGAVIGTSDLRLKNVHGTGFNDTNLNSSSGCLIGLRGFNNQILGGTIQSGGASIESGICMVSATNSAVLGIIVSNYQNCFTADSNSKQNYTLWVDNGTCGTSPAFTDSGGVANGNQWINGGKGWTFGKSFFLNMSNTVISGTFPSIAAGGCGGSGAALSGTPSGTMSFAINTGTGPGTTCTVTMPATGSGWICSAYDATIRTTTDGSWDVKPDPTSTSSSLVLKFFASSGSPTAPPASNVIRISCMGY